MVTHTVDVAARKNLAQISKILTQITSGSEFGDDNPVYVPINDYVRKTIARMSAWMFEGQKLTTGRLHPPECHNSCQCSRCRDPVSRA